MKETDGKRERRRKGEIRTVSKRENKRKVIVREKEKERESVAK